MNVVHITSFQGRSLKKAYATRGTYWRRGTYWIQGANSNFYGTWCISYIYRPDTDQHQAPSMMTFKQFLNAQDDNIDDMEAVKKYQEYKVEFRKTQMSDFFQQHKDEEWYVCL